MATDHEAEIISLKELAELPEGQIIGFDYERNCNEKKVELREQMSGYEKVTIMVAGKPRMGKSTALNNLLGLKLPAYASGESVTKDVIDHTITQNNVLVRYIDTPGLGALDVSSKKTLDDINKTLDFGDDNFTLLYCHSISNSFDDGDGRIVRKLTSSFGPAIWKRCVLVLTCCDRARDDDFEKEAEDEEYKKFLSSHVKQFKESFRNQSLPIPPVQLIWDYNDDKAKSGIIVAVPVARTSEKGIRPSILPGIDMGEDLNWTDYVFLEILKKSGKFSFALIKLRYQLVLVGLRGAVRVVVGGVVGGAAGGAAAGGIVGAVGGPFVAAAAAGVGGICGLVVGAGGTVAKSEITAELVRTIQHIGKELLKRSHR